MGYLWENRLHKDKFFLAICRLGDIIKSQVRTLVKPPVDFVPYCDYFTNGTPDIIEDNDFFEAFADPETMNVFQKDMIRLEKKLARQARLA